MSLLQNLRDPSIRWRNKHRDKSQRDHGFYYKTVKRLDSLMIPWRCGVTVQTLLRHRDNPTAIGWAHNLLEKEPTKITRYGFRPKPAGWGNGGGGLEKLIYVPNLDRHLTELQNLKLLFPGHPILKDPYLSEEEKIIIAGGIRELLSETGYRDFRIITDYPGIFLYDYVYRDWFDENGIVNPGGHRKITLWGEVDSFKVYEADHIEKHEVDKTDWFDMAEPLPAQFFNRLGRPDRPYWSHVRSSLIGMLRIYGYLKANSDHYYVPNIPNRIHSTWWYIFKVGKGDPRFPAEGYKMSPAEWYRVFDYMVENELEEVDNDFLAEFLERSLTKVMKREEDLKATELQSETSEAKVNIIDDSEDCEGIPTLEEMRQIEDEEYARWFEGDIVTEQRVARPVM